MRALVTGGAGFIGSALVDRLLAEGHGVDVIDDLSTGALGNLAAARADARGRAQRTHTLAQADVTDASIPEAIERLAPDVVFHLAGPTARRPRVIADVAPARLSTALRVLDGVRRAGCARLVTVASARAQFHAEEGIIDRAILEYLRARRESDGLMHATVVLPTVYGPRQQPTTESAVVAVLVARATAGEPCVLHDGGSATRDLLYVDDAVDALVRAAGASEPDVVVEIGTGVQTSVADVAAMVAAATEQCGLSPAPAPAVGARRTGEPGAVPVDPSAALELLGWRSFTPITEGVRATLLASLSGGART